MLALLTNLLKGCVILTDSVADICGKAQEKAFERNFNGVYVAP